MDKENINIDSQEVSQENIVEVASGSSDPAFSSHETNIITGICCIPIPVLR